MPAPSPSLQPTQPTSPVKIHRCRADYLPPESLKRKQLDAIQPSQPSPPLPEVSYGSLPLQASVTPPSSPHSSFTLSPDLSRPFVVPPAKRPPPKRKSPPSLRETLLPLHEAYAFFKELEDRKKFSDLICDEEMAEYHTDEDEFAWCE